MVNHSHLKTSGSCRIIKPWAVALLITVCSFPSNETRAQVPTTSFSQLLEKQMRQVFDSASKYVEQHPDAEDVDSAYQWVFRLALDYRFEADAVQLSTQYLERQQPVSSVKKLAQQVLVLGQARQGKNDQAKTAFLQYLKQQPAYTAEQNIGFALQLASEAQLQQQYALAADIYTSTARRFNLNPQIRDLCENNVSKLRLINETAPPIAALDVAKQRVDISSYRGKVLLIDFWATNCPPCLEELPHMKRLYHKYHSRGLEILGVSLDVHQKTVVQFQQERKIPWRLMMIDASAGSLRQPYKIASIPAVYLVNRKGKIVQFDLRGQDLAKAIKQLIESPNSP